MLDLLCWTVLLISQTRSGLCTNFDRGKRGGPRVCEMSETDLWARFVGNPGHMASFVVYAQATWWNGNFCYTVVSLFITYYPLTIITHFFVIDKQNVSIIHCSFSIFMWVTEPYLVFSGHVWLLEKIHVHIHIYYILMACLDWSYFISLFNRIHKFLYRVVLFNTNFMRRIKFVFFCVRNSVDQIFGLARHHIDFCIRFDIQVAI